MKITHKILTVSLLSMTMFVLAGCQNNEANEAKQASEQSLAKQIQNYPYTKTQKKELKWLKQYDNSNPYTKITYDKTRKTYFQDGVALPKLAYYQNIAKALKDQRETVHVRAGQLINKKLTAKQKQDKSLAIKYVNVFEAYAPYSMAQLQVKIDNLFTPGMGKQILIDNKNVDAHYGVLAKYALIQKYGLTKLPDAKTATAYLKSQQYTPIQIAIAILKLKPLLAN